MIVCRWIGHRSRPRLVIPDQQIHFSAFPGDVYTPRATLAYDVDIPTVPQNGSGGLRMTEPLAAELPDEGETTRLLTSLLSDQQKTLQSLGEVLPLLHSSKPHPLSTHRRHTSDRSNSLGIGNEQTIPTTPWGEQSIHEQSGLKKFALAVIYDVTCTISFMIFLRGIEVC